jgi:adenine deaminase
LTNEKIFKGAVNVKNGKIASIVKDENVTETQYILPGLIDSHIHIESSMLIPSEFARLAVVHGTVATVSDPHEIANVLGIDGIRFMIENGKKVPFKFYFGASSCVPATEFETAGNKIDKDGIEELLAMPEIKYMSEMMNFPGVISGDNMVLGKIAVAKKYNKPIDGHAPGLKGEAVKKYIEAGITTDHECFTMEEALEKIKYGMKIQIREGSAAKNFEALIGLMDEHADKVLFCSDDKHPDDLVNGHINQMVVRAIKKGYDPIQVLKSVILNPVEHYKLEIGLLRESDSADFIVVNNLEEFKVLKTYIEGILVAENGKTLIDSVKSSKPNFFTTEHFAVADLQVKPGKGLLQVITAFDGQLITGVETVKPKIENGFVVSDTMQDVLKMVVQNRYSKAVPAIAFIKNFGFKRGAIASSVAHDSHNIIAVGVSDEDIAAAINLVIEQKGGVAIAVGDEKLILPLPVAGLMSANDAYQVAELYHKLDRKAHEMGSNLRAPFMTLSFMALLVIPAMKLSDKGIFDGNKFAFTPLFT